MQGKEPHLPHSLVLPGQELLGTALSPRVQQDPARRGRQRLGPPLLGTPRGRCCDLQHVAVLEPHGGILTVPSYRVSICPG